MSVSYASTRIARRTRAGLLTAILSLVLLLPLAAARGQSVSGPTTTPATAPAATQPADATSLPHIRIDRHQGWIDVDATVVLRQGQWLELLACTPGTREHEAILTLQARPSHVHLALLILGLEPGSPQKWQRTGDKLEVQPPRGPRVAISVIVPQEPQPIETPANHWIRNQKTGQPLPDNLWLFTGSDFGDLEGQRVYRADLSGTCISLVNFGDDMLGRATDMTNQNDDATWAAWTDRIPPVGTKVTLRLRPVKTDN